jgi:hypothetical protein
LGFPKHSISTSSSLWERFITLEKGKAVPATPIHVALYLTYLLDNGSSCSVIQCAVYGIKWAHNLQGLQDPTDNSFVHNLVETEKRQPRQPKSTKDHVTTESLIELCTKIVLHYTMIHCLINTLNTVRHELE